MIMRSKFIFFMRLKVSILFHDFNQEVNTHNHFLSFDLMIDLLVTSTIVKWKFADNAFLSFDLMNDLLAASAIMRSELFKFIKLHLWLIFSPNY
jgi:hypothetical protein